MMDYLTDWSPEDVLDAAELYFARDWPYGGHYTRSRFSIDLTLTYESRAERLGCIGEMFSLVIWVASLGFKDLDRPVVKTAQIFAVPSGVTPPTRVTVQASEPQWQELLERWVTGGMGYDGSD